MNSQALVRLAFYGSISSIHFARASILFQKIGAQIKKLNKIVSLASNNFVLQQKCFNTIASKLLLFVEIAVYMTDVIKREMLLLMFYYARRGARIMHFLDTHVNN